MQFCALCRNSAICSGARVHGIVVLLVCVNVGLLMEFDICWCMMKRDNARENLQQGINRSNCENGIMDIIEASRMELSV
jgi:hypothetical protein